MHDFISQAHAATNALRSLFEATPLQRNDYLSRRFGADIWLKREDLSPVRSYKLRGAFTAMRAIRQSDPDQNHFVCASAGNHAQGVAYACHHFGVQGTIFMPVTTPQQKIKKTRDFGGDKIKIIMQGDYFDQTLAAAQAFCTKERASFLSPFDDLNVILGQSSVGVEILEQLGQPPDMVILPVGGGGLSAGVTTYLRTTAPHTSFRFVEPTGGASLQAALRAGQPTSLPQVNSFVDGASVARIGQHNFEMLNWVRPEDVLLASEDHICITMLDMLNIEGIVLEPAGALSIDVLPQIADQIAGRTIVCVTSGGNFDFERLPEVKERAQRAAGLKKYLIVRMPQRPGALREFLNLLGPDDDITRFEYLKKSARNYGSVLIGIESKNKENFSTFFAKLDETAMLSRDITNDDTLAEFLI